MKLKKYGGWLTACVLLLMSCFSIKKNPDGTILKQGSSSQNPQQEQSKKQKAVKALPDSSRYTTMVLAQGLDEPLGMDFMPNNNVLFIERKGAVKLYVASRKEMKTIAHFDVFSGIEDGLLGVAFDPDYEKNNWVYFYYAVNDGKMVNRLSRFELKEEALLLKTEKVLLEIPTQRKYCCHSGGAIVFGPDKLMYLSTGDNTNAEEAEGYVPIDERPGHELADDQATAANTNDLRGKILRIKPETDGTYSIPEGNLFPKGTTNARPEIYVMGTRNPYKISIDAKTNYLYWGDVGPATKVPGVEGTLSYDEINQARKPGFFGWPYFLGNNEAFPYYDFATKKEGPKFNPINPLNQSPNNTGLKELPAAQPAFIWYGRLDSKLYPEVGKGGASAMVGPIFYSDQYQNSKYKLSDYYDGKFFIFDWVRRWILAVTFDSQGNYQSMEPFLQHLKLVAPMDMKIGPDGALYILEYGTNWFSKNMDARLVRIEYTEGNRNPIAAIKSSGSFYGSAPMKIQLTAAGSKDYDKNDVLTYEWELGDQKIKGFNLDHTFDKNGIYNINLNVYDDKGGKGFTSIQVKVGNTPPGVNIITQNNRTFYWDNSLFNYQVVVKDKEDQEIDAQKINIGMTYVAHGKDIAGGFMDKVGGAQYIKGAQMVANMDCRACHSVDQTSVGPTYKAIAAKYAKASPIEQLMKKIVVGGSGTWGTREMPPHPDLSKEDAEEMVRYILSVNDQPKKLPVKGSMKLTDHIGKGNDGSYVFTASYTDKGANQIEPLFTRKYFTLRNPLVQIEDNDGGDVRISTITTAFLSFGRTKNNSFVRFNQLDLTEVKALKYRIQENGVGGNIELHLDSLNGPLVSTIAVGPAVVTDLKSNWKEITAPVKLTKGIHDLFVVFTNPVDKQKNIVNIDWIYFSR
jgi:cytochrome c